MDEKLKKAALKLFIIGVIIISSLVIITDLNKTRDYTSFERIVDGLSTVFVTIFIWIGASTIVNVLWKKFPWENKPKKHLIILIISLTIWPTIVMVAIYGFIKVFILPDIVMGSFMNSILEAIFITFLVTAIFEAYFFYKQWKEHFAKSVKLEKSNLEAKYETLKTQINPHFLFNSLNTLMTYIEENSKASEYVQNLSDFMRYVLKSREKEVVLLREELDIAKKYSYLQQSRFGENLIINFEVSEKYFHFSIIPLAIQMLIENAIKHNIISKDKPLTIKIFIKNNSFIVVENNLQKKSDTPSTKLGLTNISERYKFLTPKDVEIKETSNKFAVSLPLVIVDI